MGTFAADRDLLVYEPNIFRDVGWVGQRLVKGTGTISGTTLTLSAQDVPFDAAGVTTGSVVTVAGTAYEVMSRLSATSLQISRLREDSPSGMSTAVITPSPATAQECIVMTFVPQLSSAHRQILRLAGLDPDEPTPSGAPTQASIANSASLRRLECLGALALIWWAAAGLMGDGSAAAERGEWYRRRFETERARVNIKLDTNADGLPDATRRLSAGWMRRG
ncbi:MAG: hypothetical protein AABZ53_06905 [Planctomycetota bacterium]